MNHVFSVIKSILISSLISVVLFGALMKSPWSESVGVLKQAKAGCNDIWYQALQTSINVWRTATGSDPWTLAQVKAEFGALIETPQVLIVEKGSGRIISGTAPSVVSNKPTVPQIPDIPQVAAADNAYPNAALNDKGVLATAKSFPLVTIPYYYDGDDAPEAWPPEKAKMAITKAAAEWRAVCNINFVYNGDRATSYSDSSKTRDDGIGVIRWSDMEDDILGRAHTGTEEEPANGFWLQLSQSHFNDDSDAKAELLHHVLVHELGHVIGFKHSPSPKSVMYASAEDPSGDPEELVPGVTVSDAKYCWYLRHRWSGKSVVDSEKLAGVSVH